MRLQVCILGTLAAMPVAVLAADAEGCADLKPLPRLEACVIVECSAKQHDSFDAPDANGAPSDANTNSLAYSCPVADPQKMAREFDTQLRKAGYQNITPDKSDPASPTLTARKGAQWIHWSANTEDGATTYSFTAASDAGEKFKAEACAQPPTLSALKQCEVVECNSKSEDSVSMRTALKEETALTGNVQTVTLACPASGARQVFSALESELKTSGFEILFSDREHPESGWITARTGKRWVELTGAPDGESISYALTLVPSAEVLTAAKSAPVPIPAAAPEQVVHPVAVPTPAPAPVQAVIAPAPTVRLTPPSPPVNLVQGFVPPKSVLQVPIEPTQDRINSVAGDVVIHMLVDVDENGSVTKAVVTGRVTKDVLKLQSAALEAVSHWRFEPARQDGRIVPAVKIAVQMHFRGRPWRF
jgi:TonB family protein